MELVNKFRFYCTLELDDIFLVFGLGRERLVSAKSKVGFQFPPGFMLFWRTPAIV
jgi:hypothetical protein